MIEEEKVQVATQTVEEKKAQFFKDLTKSTDLHDNLQDLTNFICEHTGATGAYIGYLQPPEVCIEDHADEDDHLDHDKPSIIKFTHATADHSHVVGATLEPDQGITHEVFNQPPVPDAAEPVEGEEEVEKPPMDILDEFKHVYVKEVVREPKMNY